jgi:protein involved in sex pheromone biosynthesis
MKHNIVRIGAIAVLGTSFLLAGCEREVSKTEDTKVKSDGTVKSKEKTVTENPDGTVTKKETEKSTAPPKP